MVTLLYKDQEINQRDTDGWVNLTQMGKANNARLDKWQESPETQKYLKALQESGISSLIVVKSIGFPAIKTTWGHPLVAELFTQWISKQNLRTKYKTKTGVIYIYVDNGNNAYKVGFTTDLKAREKQHKTSNPFLELVKVYKVESIDTETLIHEKLKPYRIPKTTEWYKKHPDVLKIVRLLCTEKTLSI